MNPNGVPQGRARTVADPSGARGLLECPACQPTAPQDQPRLRGTAWLAPRRGRQPSGVWGVSPQIAFQVCRERLAGQAHSTQDIGPEGLPQTLAFAFVKAMVEAGMVGNEQTPVQAIGQFCRDQVEIRSPSASSTPILVMRSRTGLVPVVSRSMKASRGGITGPGPVPGRAHRCAVSLPW